LNERERWFVYPLLFLALGAALRDKLIDRTTTKSIVCQELVVVDEQPLGREPVLLARIGPQDSDNGDPSPGGELLLNGQFAIVDPGPAGLNQTVKKVVRIGRGPAKGGPTIGYIWLAGEMVVNGPINAMYYAYQGVPFAPALRRVLPVQPRSVAPGEQPVAPQASPSDQPNATPQTSPPAQAPESDAAAPANSVDDDSEVAPSQ
jgi:hypothetical protein